MHTPSAVDGVPESSHFGVYQQMDVDTGDVSIRTLVPAAISTVQYRKALIANLFFRQILALTDTPYTSFNDLMTTVALYVLLNTGAAERGAESTVGIIRFNFFIFLICRVLVSLIPPGNLLWSRTQTIAL